MLEMMLDGYNCAIIAYGQTGGGKTYTLLGPGYDHPDHIGKSSHDLQGLVPNLLEGLFNDVYNNFDYSIHFAIYASYI